MTGDQSATFTLFPTVAVSRGRRYLELAIVASVADASAFGATAQGSCQTAGSTLEDVLEIEKKKV